MSYHLWRRSQMRTGRGFRFLYLIRADDCFNGRLVMTLDTVSDYQQFQEPATDRRRS